MALKFIERGDFTIAGVEQRSGKTGEIYKHGTIVQKTNIYGLDLFTIRSGGKLIPDMTGFNLKDRNANHVVGDKVRYRFSVETPTPSTNGNLPRKKVKLA